MKLDQEKKDNYKYKYSIQKKTFSSIHEDVFYYPNIKNHSESDLI